MGCDIHLYVEYKSEDSPDWHSFGGRMDPGRNYNLFAKLAGVRNYEEIQPIAPLRGVPDDMGWIAKHDYWLYVTPAEARDAVAPCIADKWVAQGIARFLDDKESFISNPDWHSMSWLTLDEFEQAIFEFNEPEYNAVLAAMRSFEHQGFKTRVVFWFDN